MHTYIHHSRMKSMQTTNTFVVHIAYNYIIITNNGHGMVTIGILHVRKMCMNYS